MKCVYRILKVNYLSEEITHKAIALAAAMKEKRLRSLKVKVIQVFSKWQEPHESSSYRDSGILQSIHISDDGDIDFTIKPKHPHCPCCLFDASQLRQKLLSIKDVKSVYCEVTDIPGKEKWTRSINS